MRWLFVSSLVVVLAGCPSDPEETGVIGETDPVTDPSCTYSGHTTVYRELFVDTTQQSWLVWDQDEPNFTGPYNALSFDIYRGFGAPSPPFSHTFTGEGFASCSVCLLAFRGCDDSQGTCEQVFLAESGEVDVVEATLTPGTAFEATLTDLRFIEVTLNYDTNTTTPVPDGETWCVDSLSIEGTAESP